jgi:hypothetical protein
MTERLTVKIPLKNPNYDVNASAVEELIIEHQSEFEPLLERAIDVDDARVQLVDDSLEVEQIEFGEDGSSGVAEVEFMSSFYAGCKDMNSDEWHTETLPFQIVDGVLIFEIDLPVRWRVDN